MLLLPSVLLPYAFERVFDSIKGDILQNRSVIVSEDESTEGGDSEASPEEEELYYELEQLYNQPVNINTAGIDKMREVPFLSDQAIRKIIARRELRPFEELDELLDSGIISENDFDIMEEFMAVEDVLRGRPYKSWSFRLESSFSISVDESDTINLLKFENLDLLKEEDYFDNFLGATHLFQFKKKGAFEINAGIQHDAYERDYFDLIKFSGLFEFPVAVSRLALGALTTRFGQQLLFSTTSSYLSPSSSTFTGRYTKGSKVDVSRGSSEHNVNGFSALFTHKSLELITMYGIYNYDSTLYGADEDSFYVNNLSDSDDARDSVEEVERKNNQLEHIAAMNLDIKFNPFSYMGVGFLFSHFRYPIVPEFEEHEIYDFYGDTYGGMSLHGTFARNGLTFYFENSYFIAPDEEGAFEYQAGDEISYTIAPALFAGMEVAKLKTLQYSLSFRAYSKNTPFLHSASFDASTAHAGVYNAFKWQMTDKIKLSAFIDLRKDLYLDRYGNSPYVEADFGTELNWKVFSKLKMILRQRVKNEERKNPDLEEYLAATSYDTTMKFIWKVKRFQLDSSSSISFTDYGSDELRVSADTKVGLDLMLTPFYTIDLSYEVGRNGHALKGFTDEGLSSEPYSTAGWSLENSFDIGSVFSLDFSYGLKYEEYYDEDEDQGLSIDRKRYEDIRLKLVYKM